MENREDLWSGWDTAKVLGRGSYGSVYQIERHIPGRTEKEQAALKVMSIPQSQEDIAELTSQGYDKASITQYYKNQLDELIREYAIMLELKGHTNIVYCDEVKWSPHDDGIGWNVYIKMELLKPLKSVLGNTYDENAVIRLGRDIARALVRCREKNIIHRDIKPQNILVSPKGDYKLGDFGVAKVSEKTTAGTIAGTYEYMAPEVFRGESYNSTADIYSLGIVMYWMMNNKRTPFLPQPPAIPSTADTESARTRRYAGEALPDPVNGSNALKAIVLKACAYEAKDRYLSAEKLLEELEILAHPTDRYSREDGSVAQLEPEQEDASDFTVFGNQRKPDSNKEKSKRRKYAWIACMACLCAVLGAFLLSNRTKGSSIQGQAISESENSTTGETHQLPDVAAMMGDQLHTDNGSKLWEANIMERDAGNQYATIYGSDVQRDQIISATFLDSLDNAPAACWDVSRDKDGSVLAWASGDGAEYDLYFAAEGGINGVDSSDSLFLGYTNLKSIKFNGNFHTDYATSFQSMFEECESLETVGITSLVTSNGQNFCGMFANCESLTTLDVSSMDTAQATDMRWMFANCFALQSIEFGNFVTSNVTDMQKMFQYCRKLEELDLSSFDTGNVTNMSHMFYHCDCLAEIAISSFNTENVTDMTGMFRECAKIKDIDLSNFNTEKVKSHEFFMEGNQKVNGEPWSNLFEGKKASALNGSNSWEKNVLKSTERGLWDTVVYGTEISKKDIVYVTFLDSLENAPDSCIDVSEAGDGSVKAWFGQIDDQYELFIAGEGGVNGINAGRWLFGHFTALKQVRFQENFHTEQATDLSHMFFNCGELIDVDVNTLDTRSAVSFNNMFASCGKLKELDLSGWDTSNVTNFGSAFDYCNSLEMLDLSSWNTQRAESMARMFHSCQNLKWLDLGSFKSNDLKYTSWMFKDCYNLEYLDMSEFDTSGVINMESMFQNCHMLKNVDMADFDTSKVQSRNSFMGEGKTINEIPWDEYFSSSAKPWENNVLINDYEGQWDSPLFGTEITKEQVVSVTFLDTVKDAPSSCVDVSEAGDGSVLAWVSGYDDTYELYIAGEGGVCAPESCYWMFGYYTSCRQFNFNGNFHTENVKDMSSMFYGCASLENIDVSTLSTSNVENFNGMFGACSGLTELDLRSMDTSNATSLYIMFSFCANLKKIDMSTWDTSKVNNMGWMFYHCTSLESLDLSNFDTGNVTEFYRMFSGCSKLRSVDVSSFDTSSATNMQEMFNECPLLEEMDLSHFDVSNVEKFNNFMDHSKKVNGKSWLKMFS